MHPALPFLCLSSAVKYGEDNGRILLDLKVDGIKTEGFGKYRLAASLVGSGELIGIVADSGDQLAELVKKPRFQPFLPLPIPGEGFVEFLAGFGGKLIIQCHILRQVLWSRCHRPAG